MKDTPANAWAEFGTTVPDAFHEDGLSLCGLCANRGFIDTRDSAQFQGTACGVLAYCICPNGRGHKRRRGLKKWGGSSVMLRRPISHNPEPPEERMAKLMAILGELQQEVVELDRELEGKT